MNAWSALTAKEFRLGLPAFLVAIIAIAGVVLAAYFTGRNFGIEEELLTGALVFVVVLHFFFLVFYLFYTLNAERKRLHLWLHTPMSIAGLLLSKVFTGIVFMAVTFGVSFTLLVTMFNQNFDFLGFEITGQVIGYTSIGIFGIALSIAAWFIFFWSIYLFFGQRMNDFLSFILTFVIFGLSIYLYEQFLALSFMETLTMWGPIFVEDILVGMEFAIMQDAIDVAPTSTVAVLYIGEILLETITTVLLFLGACWMIDRKVEV